jgi:hypothetical protein
MDASAVIARVRAGEGLKDAITQEGLPIKETLLWFQDHGSAEYYEAKVEASPQWKRRRG